VAQELVQNSFDRFVEVLFARLTITAQMGAGLPQSENQAKLDPIHAELFIRRNRVMHWGKMDYKLDDAKSALQAGCTAFAVLKNMDKERCEAMERAWRDTAQNKLS